MRKSILNQLHDRRGFSMVELMVVVAILAVVMMAVVSLYIPVQRSTAAQTQVSDVQSNLRLALNTMTRDLLLAGFLVAENPVVFENSSDFTIRTHIVGHGFARVSNATDMSGIIRLTAADSDMIASFPEGSRVRLFGAISAQELREDPVDGTVTDVDRAYPVDASDTATRTIDIDTTANTTLVAATINSFGEAILIRIIDENQPVLQTIRYHLEDDVLVRTINGSRQILARNLDVVEFDWCMGSDKCVDIKLTGKTRAVGNDSLASEKVRSVETSVKLRNVY